MENITKELLQNGIMIYYIPLKNTHSVVTSLFIRGGNRYEKKETIGISHLIEHLLFRRLNGTEQSQLYYEYECIGTTLRASTYKDFIRFYIETLPKYSNDAFNFIYKTLLQNKWNSEDIRKEKVVVENQINERTYTYNDQNSSKYWNGTVYEKLIMGNISNIAKISSKTIHSYYNYFFKPQNCCLVVSGNINNNEINFFKEKLQKLHNNQEPLMDNDPLFPVNIYHRSSKDDYIFNNSYDYTDVEIWFEVDYKKVSIECAEYLKSILGDGDGSPLSLLLREELGLVDHIYASFEKYNGFGILSINFDVLCENLIPALDSVFSTVCKLKENISDRDINASKVFLTENWDFL